MKTVCIGGPKHGDVVEVPGKEWRAPRRDDSSIDTVTYRLGYVTFETLEPFLFDNISERSDVVSGLGSDARLIEAKAR